MKTYGKVICLCWLFCWGLGNVVTAENSNDDLKQQLEALNQRLEQNMLQSNQQLAKGDFQKAEHYTNNVLQDLDSLIEAMMPLDERINQLIEDEEAILEQTRTIRQRRPTETVHPHATKPVEDLVFEQIKTREKTKMASTQADKRLEAIRNKQPKTGSQPQPTPNRDSALKTLQEVKGLLDDSEQYQTLAIDHLEETRLALAEQKEASALDAMKQALEKLRQHAKSSSGNQNSSPPDQKKNDEQKAASSNPSQAKQSDDNNSNSQDSQKAAQENKMKPEEALKELSKLRKQAREEQERRRRQYGIQAPSQQVPVDKNW